MIWRKLAYLWQTPSAFYDDWRKYARNQLGHALVVGILPGFFLGHFAGFGLALYAVWEITQWQFRRALASDCVEDWAFVACGAAFGVTGSVWFLVVMMAFLAAGVLWRVEQS